MSPLGTGAVDRGIRHKGNFLYIFDKCIFVFGSLGFKLNRPLKLINSRPVLAAEVGSMEITGVKVKANCMLHK